MLFFIKYYLLTRLDIIYRNKVLKIESKFHLNKQASTEHDSNSSSPAKGMTLMFKKDK